MVSTTGVIAEACLGFEGVIYPEGVVQRKEQKQRVNMWVKPIASLVHVPHPSRRGSQSTRDWPDSGFKGWVQGCSSG